MMTVLSEAWPFPSNVKSLFMAGTVAIAAIASATVADAQAVVSPDFAQVHVMTRNVYDGIDYQRRFGPGNNPSGELSETWDAILSTDPFARAALHAGQIAREHPDLLAIQEAVFAQNGDTRVDMLSNLVRALAKLGKPYEIIAAMKGLDTGGGNTIRVSIWDAILVRSDLAPHDRVVDDRKQGLYKLSYNAMTLMASAPDNLTNPFATSTPFASTPPFANMNFRRNWMFVDMHLRGYSFRFVTTHLDDELHTARKQAAELMEVVGNTRLPVIVTGDFNYAYDDFTYADYPGLAAAGYRDAWIESDGATCCQDKDKDKTCCQDQDKTCCDKTCCTWGLYPTNSPWKRTEKIDLILLRGGVSATSARLIGTIAPPCSGHCALLASDHAGVVAGLVFTSTIDRRLFSLLIAISGMLLLAGLFVGVSRWLRRGRQ
jgi:endonuclease/exonuclease/phosphatase family metal-dependent hydrolase